MRTINISGGGLSGSATIPDAVVYAFNPNYVELSLSGFTGVVKLVASSGGREYDIDVTVFNGSARCYVSRLLQLFFDDYVNTRSKSVTLSIRTEEGVSAGSASCMVLWAALEAGLEYGYYLPVVSDRNGGGKRLREIVWFTGLPFKVSLFSASSGITEADPSSVNDAGIRLIRDSSMEGTYLRWIDNYGFWQYYLFDSGQRKSKNKLGGVSVDAEYSVSGVRHQAQRHTHIENTDTIKCCAVNLKKEILAYVETIYKSPHIELYVGKVDGTEVWKPVSIEAGNLTVAADKKLYDYEISVTLPETQVQTI